MKILTSHKNIDFDGFASLVGASLLHTNAQIALPDEQQQGVKNILTLYRDHLNVVLASSIQWEDVTELIIVDASSLQRCGIPCDKLAQNISITIYDHHEQAPDDKATQVFQEPVGACVTLLIEELQKKQTTIHAPEATLMGLGLYSDTGSFQHSQTTERDLLAAAFLLQNGLDLEVIKPFLEEQLTVEQQTLFSELSDTYTTYDLEGISIALCTGKTDKYVNGLAAITEKLIDILPVDAVVSIVQMNKHIYMNGRSLSNRLNLHTLFSHYGGGGHKQAAAATVKNEHHKEIVQDVADRLYVCIQPAVTAGLIMTSPVHTLIEEMSIDEAADLLIRYGHTGMPVLNESNKVTGMLSRRDLDKAQRHGLGHAPVHAYMSKELITLDPESTIDDIQHTLIANNIGRIPVLDKGDLLGIVSRTDLLSIMHNEETRKQLEAEAEHFANQSLAQELQTHYPKEIYELLVLIGKQASLLLNTKSYLVGGGVRDVLLGRHNEDLDIVIEGDAIHFANLLADSFGGHVKAHPTFGTATWTTSTEIKVDIATSRSEHYHQPAVLPEVHASGIREDLSRRDFTINAMALSLHPNHFGQLLDHFNGQRDLKNGQVRILHPLSFIEDPTRIFRAVRFAHRFSYQIHPHTQALAKVAGHALQGLSATRIMHELDLMHKEQQLENAMQSLHELGVWVSLLKTEPKDSQWKHIKQLAETNICEPFTLLAALTYQENGTFNDAIHAFALSSKDVALVKSVEETNLQDLSSDLSLGEWHHRLYFVSKDSLLFIGLVPDLPVGNTILQYVQARDEIKPLLVGRDLLEETQIKPGPIYTKILINAFSLQLDGELTTKEDALAWAKSYNEEEPGTKPR